MKVLNAEQMREADRLTTAEYGIPSLQLMENAGASVASYLLRSYPDLARRKILILCGKGNNGGDGFVVARRLHESGASPTVILFAEPSAVRGDAREILRLLQQQKIDLRVVTSDSQWQAARELLNNCDIVVDGLLGTGISSAVEGLLATVIRDVNAAAGHPSKRGALRRRQVISIDMPSGLAAGMESFDGPVVSADATITFTAPKLGQMLSARADQVGKLIVSQIGTPPAMLDEDTRLRIHWIEPSEFAGLPMKRSADANKGRFGHALIIAGSLGKSGAAALAGHAALRAGAGLVTVATPSSVLGTVAASAPELMTAPLQSTDAGTASVANLDYGKFEELLKGKSVLAAGPGLSTHTETQQYVRAILMQTEMPVILDADGLNAYAGRADELSARRPALLAITPHPGEMARLLGISIAEVQSRRLDVAVESAARWRAYVVLKGFHTILATPDGRAFINTTGNPGMATGGTGDVLTGMLAGLTAAFGTEQWERVLALGIYLHGLAGDLAAAKVGEAPLIASDLIAALPGAYAHVMEQWETAPC
jgi:NAD(P)H-hydrate epimerase